MLDSLKQFWNWINTTKIFPWVLITVAAVATVVRLETITQAQSDKIGEIKKDTHETFSDIERRWEAAQDKFRDNLNFRLDRLEKNQDAIATQLDSVKDRVRDVQVTIEKDKNKVLHLK